MTRKSLAVVMPNYNHSQFLPRAIESIVSQSRPPDEFFILDDASTDNSVEILEEYAQKYACIRIVRNQQNEGVNAANRKLFSLTDADYIHPAAADDERLPGFFETAMSWAEQQPAAGLVFGDVQVRNEAGDSIGRVSVERWGDACFASPEQYLAEYLESELASHSASGATIYRREPFLEVGGYREELGPWADTFAARAIALKHGACYLPQLCAVDYRLPQSFSQQAKDNPRRSLDVIARAAHLMRSPEFHDRFPPGHVARWEKQFRSLVAWNYFLGPATIPRPSFLARNLKRLPRVLSSLMLFGYAGDLSCYAKDASQARG